MQAAPGRAQASLLPNLAGGIPRIPELRRERQELHCSAIRPDIFTLVSLGCKIVASLDWQGPPSESSANAGWWREHLGRDLSGANAPRPPPLQSHPISESNPTGASGDRARDEELQRATAAWSLGGVLLVANGRQGFVDDCIQSEEIWHL